MLQVLRQEALTRFAGRGEEVRDDVPLGATDRLADFVREALEHCEAEVPEDWQRRPLEVQLDFTSRAAGGRLVPAVTGHASVALPVTCERCLGLMELALEADIAFLLPEEETGAEGFPGFEVWPTDARGIRLLDLVEEELLLALPLALMHEELEDKGKARCRPLAEGYEGEENSGTDTQRPFGALRALMQDEEQDD